MSGYLHRMLGQLKAPVPSGIRPLVGSLYTSPAAQPGLHESHEELAAAAPARAFQAQERVSSPQASPVSSIRDPFLPLTEHQPRSASPTTETQIPVPNAVTPIPLMTETHPSQRSAGPTATSESQNLPPVSPAPESASDSATSHILRATEISSVLPIAPMPQPLMPRQARPAPLLFIPAAAASPAPVADEIHINIGRIEVTAVPQAPTSRPAPRQSRRGFSLDEYLRKSDGRAQ